MLECILVLAAFALIWTTDMSVVDAAKKTKKAKEAEKAKKAKK